jgi:transposase
MDILHSYIIKTEGVGIDMARQLRHYSTEYKAEAVKMVLQGKQSQNQIAQELGISATTLCTWVQRYKANPEQGIESSQVQSIADLEFRKLQRKYKELEEENAILKKAAAYFARNQK